MKYSTLIGKTSRQKLPGSEITSHQLLLRAGFITPVAAGIYSFLPLGFRVLENIDRIIKEEFTKRGIQHIIMPFVHPASLWKETGRFTKWAKALAVFDAKSGGKYLLAPTHEETVTDIARKFVLSYKDMPVIVNQNQWKYRDEVRVNGGLLRTREFLMQDAYSFDKDEEGLATSFDTVSEAYHAIFDRIGLPVTVVKADSGAIGGTGSEEFMVESEVGEDRIFVCDRGDYKANVEKAESAFPQFNQMGEEKKPMQEVLGEGIIGVEPLAKFLNIPVQKTTKTLLYQADDRVVAVCVRGEYSVSEIKLSNILKCMNLGLASADTVKRVTGADVGYAGPVGLPKDVEVIWDKSTEGRVNFECGGNKTHYHNINVNFGADVATPKQFVDVREVKSGEGCPKCDGTLSEAHTIELGHVFKLGTIYSKAMHAEFIDQDGKKKPIIMGCYGIGMTRLIAAAVEVFHDERGIIWPEAIAPFRAHLISLPGGETKAAEVYDALLKAGVDVLWDDREGSAGVKFADADLIGLPWRFVISKKTEGKIEIKKRTESEAKLVSETELMSLLANK